MLPGDPKVPIIYEVDRIRDGSSFTTRRVVAIQHGQAIFAMSASFHLDEEGFDASGRDAGGAGTRRAAERGGGEGPSCSCRCRSPCAPITSASGRIEIRPVEINRYHVARSDGEPRFHVWIRPPAACRRSGDPPMRARLCLRHDAPRHLAHSPRPHGVRASIQPASLDHAMWFHRPFRADEWLLYAQDTPKRSRRARLLPRPRFSSRMAPWSPRWRRKASSASAD